MIGPDEFPRDNPWCHWQGYTCHEPADWHPQLRGMYCPQHARLMAQTGSVLVPVLIGLSILGCLALLWQLGGTLYEQTAAMR